MRAKLKEAEGKPVPPYGPAQGMIQGLDLLRRAEPAVVDIDFLRSNGVAPGNEYKVVGALKYLGLIDDAGTPTDKARLIRVRGMAFTQNLRKIIREAYLDLHKEVDISKANADEIYNHFVIGARLKPEMARKASRFFIQLCQLAELPVATVRPEAEVKKLPRNAAPKRRQKATAEQSGSQIVLNLTLAVDPSIARMEEAELAALMRKIMRVAQEVSQGSPMLMGI